MKRVDMVTDARIKKFMASKSRKFPELNDVDIRPRKVPVYQRGRIIDEINYFFGVPQPGV